MNAGLSCLAALVLLLGAPAAGAMQAAPPQQQAAPQPCYPGLPCPGAQDGQDQLPPQVQRRTGEKFFYVGTVRPPDPWLALRTEPSTQRGRRIMKMPQGTLLRQIERRGFWWYVELTTGQRGWAHSKWIACCKTADE